MQTTKMKGIRQIACKYLDSKYDHTLKYKKTPTSKYMLELYKIPTKENMGFFQLS
jgi:hypothetical protein